MGLFLYMPSFGKKKKKKDLQITFLCNMAM